METMETLVTIKNLKKYFKIPEKGELHAVDGISFDILKGETLGLVGESGCGKSTVGNVIMRIHEATDGEINFDSKNILLLNSAELKEMRKEIQIVFQDPFSSLNPKKTIRTILAEPYKIHKTCKRKEINERVDSIIEKVGLEPYVLRKFPHELDGGKRQMVGIARALSLNPKFIVCDEPVSSLDVSVQATIINLLSDMQKKLGLTYLFISHDLSVVRHISNRVAVMYLGQIVEIAPTDLIFENALHPYTIALLSAVPRLDFGNEIKRIVLKGDVPSPLNPKPGCRFAPRCWMAKKECFTTDTKLIEAEEGHQVSCFHWKKTRDNIKNILFEQKQQIKDEISGGQV
jgi:oligopeptide/dipeptide ABC transporter ATP-binding protein